MVHRFTDAARAVLENAYNQGMKSITSPLFGECLGRVQQLQQGTTKRQLQVWISNRKQTEKRGAEQPVMVAQPAVAGITVEEPANSGEAVVTTPAAMENSEEVEEAEEATPSIASGSTNQQDPPRVTRKEGRITKKNPAKRTAWTVHLRQVGEQMPVGRRDIGTLSREAALRKQAMTPEEWHALEAAAEEENAALTYVEGADYTPAQKASLMRHHKDLLLKQVKILGKLGGHVVGCIMQEDQENVQNFFAGRLGEASLKLMEERDAHLWKFMSLGALGSTKPPARTIDQRRSAVRLATLNLVNNYRTQHSLPPIDRLPISELAIGCPLKFVNWPEGVSMQSKEWRRADVEVLEIRFPTIAQGYGPFLSVESCDGCPTCAIPSMTTPGIEV